MARKLFSGVRGTRLLAPSSFLCFLITAVILITFSVIGTSYGATDVQAVQAALSARSVADVEVVVDEGTGVITWLRGLFPSQAPDDPKESAYRFLEANSGVYGIKFPRDEMVELMSKTDDMVETRHVYFEQRINGIPVWNHRLGFHFDKAGNISVVNGRYVRVTTIPPSSPELSVGTAIEAAKRACLGTAMLDPGKKDLELNPSRASGPVTFNSASQPRTELLYFVDNGGQLHLTYLVRLTVDVPVGDWFVFVDAMTGNILLKYNNIQPAGPATGSGIDLKGAWVTLHDYRDIDNKFKLLDTSKYMYTHNPPLHPYSIYKGVLEVRNCKNAVDPKGNPIQNFACLPVADPNGDNKFDDYGNPDLKSNARAAVSLARGFSDVYDFWYNRLKRNGVDGKGLSLIGNVHFGKNYANGFWRPDWKMIFFGDSDAAWPYTRGKDWIAHESGHGVTQFEVPPNGLIYINESGGINEAYSDFFAMGVDYDDWDFGGEVGNLVPSRYINNPSLSNPPQPKDMYDFYSMPLEMDNGGVHFNSGIGNYAYYLLSMALPKVTPALDGRIPAYSIAYRAYRYITANPDATFREWGMAMKQAAVDLYGPGSKEYAAVVSALNRAHVPQARISAYDNGGVLDEAGEPYTFPFGAIVGWPCLSTVFDRPSTGSRLKTIVLDLVTPVSGSYEFYACAANADGSPNTATCPSPILTVPDTSAYHNGRFTNYILPQSVAVAAKFHIGVCYKSSDYSIPNLFTDNGQNPTGRAWIGTWDSINPYLVWVNALKSYSIPNNWMIRAIMEDTATGVPAAPVLSTPANGANVAATQVTFAWQAAAGATKYFLEVNTSSAWTSATRKFYGPVTGTSKIVTGFPNNGTVYYWRMWAGNTKGWSGASAVRSLTNGIKKAPVIVSLSPASPVTKAGVAQLFTAVYSDGNGYVDLKTVEFLASPDGGLANGVRVMYDRTVNKLYMYNDAGTTLLAMSCAPGAAATIQNTRGQLNCAQTTVGGTGTNLTVKWCMTPKAAFASATARQLRLKATDRTMAATVWVTKGTWKITP
jgi:bacillolysin